MIVKKENSFPFIAFLVLAGVIFLLYYPGTGGPYILDDFARLSANTRLKLTDLSLPAIYKAAFSEKSGILYRPIAMISFSLNYYIAGNTDAYSIKLTNIFIHILTTCGIFLLTIGLLRRAGIADDRRRWWTALFITALWALHPLHVSTVLYAVQRMTELAALFSVYAAVAYIRGREKLLLGDMKGLWWVAGAVVFGGVLAALSKENGVLLPLLLLVIEGVFYRFKFHPGTMPSSRYLVSAILILPSLAIFAYLIKTGIDLSGAGLVRGFTVGERLLTECRVLFFYIRLILLPDAGVMSLFHMDFEFSYGLLQPYTTLPSIIGIILLISISLYGLCRGKYIVLSFAVLWFLGGHLLESSVIPLEIIYEHRNYLPGYGILFAAGYYLTHQRLLSNYIINSIKYALIVLILILMVSSLKERVRQWHSMDSLLSHELKNNAESGRVWSVRGDTEVHYKQYEKAVSSFQMASQLSPREASYPLAGLNILVYTMKRPPPPALLAEIEWRLHNYPVTAQAVSQLLAIARNNIYMGADSHLQIERILKAATANRFWPTNDKRVAVLYLRGEALLRRNNPKEAVVALENALALIPERPDIRIKLTNAYIDMNQLGKAEQQIRWLKGMNLTPALQKKIQYLEERISDG